MRGLEEESGSMLVEPSKRTLVPGDFAITPIHCNSEVEEGIHSFAGNFLTMQMRKTLDSPVGLRVK